MLCYHGKGGERIENAVIYTVALTATVSLASFIGYRTRDRGAERMALGAILLAALVLPIAGLLGADMPLTLPKADITQESESTVAAIIEDAYVAGIKRLICTQWRLSDDAVSVSIRGFDAATVTAEHVSVTLSGTGIGADRVAVAQYLTDQGINNCEVRYEYGRGI